MTDVPRISNRAGGVAGRQRQTKPWWAGLDAECPICLTPIAELPHAPFVLSAQGSKTDCSQTIRHYFNGADLARYLLRSSDFINPVNRQPLSRSDCVALDKHLRSNHLDETFPSVVDAFDLFSQCPKGDSVQREATAVLQHLFDFQSSARARHGRTTYDSTPSVSNNGRTSAIDFPSLPAASRTSAHGSLRTAPGVGGYAPTARGSMARTGAHRVRRPLLVNHPEAHAARETVVAQIESEQQVHGSSNSMPHDSADAALASTSSSEHSPREIEEIMPLITPCSTIGRPAPQRARLLQGPLFMQPVTDEELANGVGIDGVVGTEGRDSMIEEEIDVLRAIYGEEHVTTDRCQDSQGRTCWEITVTRDSWHLHVVISSVCLYPRACPLVRPTWNGGQLSPPQAERAADVLAGAIRNGAGEPFIYCMVEALRDLEE